MFWLQTVFCFFCGCLAPFLAVYQPFGPFFNANVYRSMEDLSSRSPNSPERQVLAIVPQKFANVQIQV